MPVAERHHLRVGQRGQLRVADADRPGIRRIETAEHVQQGALPHPGGADDGHHLTFFERHVQALQDRQPRVANLVALLDVRCEEKWHPAAHWYRSACAGSSLAAWREG